MLLIIHKVLYQNIHIYYIFLFNYIKYLISCSFALHNSIIFVCIYFPYDFVVFYCFIMIRPLLKKNKKYIKIVPIYFIHPVYISHLCFLFQTINPFINLAGDYRKKCTAFNL